MTIDTALTAMAADGLVDAATATTTPSPKLTLERPLGDSELSYYLPSREDGVSDMYLRLTIKIHPKNFSPHRLKLAFSILQIQHPLLAARVESNYDTFLPPPLGTEPLAAKFVYDIPQTVDEAVERAEGYVDVIRVPVERLLEDYLDGARVLSDERVCRLLICERVWELVEGMDVDAHARVDTDTTEEEDESQIPILTPFLTADLILFCCHYIGDAGSIQYLTKDIMYLLSFPTSYLISLLQRSIDEMVGSTLGMEERKRALLLPQAMESRLPPVTGKLRSTLSRLEFMKWQGKMIGGQTFPKSSPPSNSTTTSPQKHANPTRPTKTITYEMMVPKEKTKAMLARCKQEKVTISTALFALMNYAWGELCLEEELEGRNGAVGERLPTLFYSARNMRPYLPLKNLKTDWKGYESYYYLSLSYFNVILPTFIPGLMMRGEEKGLIIPPIPTERRSRSPHSDGEVEEDGMDVSEHSSLGTNTPSSDTSTSPSRSILSTSTATSSILDTPLPPEVARKVFWHRARSARFQARPPNPESMMSLVLFISRTFQMSKARMMGALKFAVARKVKEMGVGAGAGAGESNVQRPALQSLTSQFNVPTQTQAQAQGESASTPTPAPAPTPSQTESPKSISDQILSQQLRSRAPTTALLGLSLLGNFDPLFPPPNKDASHVSRAPFDPISLGAGCRLKPGGSLLYAYTFDEQLTVVLGYDGGVLGLDEEVMRRLWERIERGVDRWMV